MNKNLLTAYFRGTKLITIDKALNFFILFFLFSGCATILHGTKERIYIQSEPSGAKIICQGRELGVTPRAIIISRKTQEITLKKDNYKPYTVKLSPKFNFGKAWLANFGVSGLSGLLFFSPIGSVILTNDNLGPIFFLGWAGWVLVGGCIVGPIIDGATGAVYDFDLPNNNLNITLGETDSFKFELARKINTLENWEEFLEEMPETSFYAARAGKILDTLRFHNARTANTIKSYKDYLIKTYPRGTFEKEARDSLEVLLWREAKFARSLEACRDYLSEFPSGKYVTLIIQYGAELLIAHPKDGVNVRQDLAKALIKFADEENLSVDAKSIIKSICPLCYTLGKVKCECNPVGYIYLYSRVFGGVYVEHYYSKCPYCDETGWKVCPSCGGMGFLK